MLQYLSAHCLSRSSSPSCVHELLRLEDRSILIILRKEPNLELVPVTLEDDCAIPSEVPSLATPTKLVGSRGGAEGALTPSANLVLGSRGNGRRVGPGSTSWRQIGQLVCEPNHLSMHSA
ncbi:hypothetical protein Hanom_Chr16g01452441 [Helianthus anomalus]